MQQTFLHPQGNQIPEDVDKLLSTLDFCNSEDNLENQERIAKGTKVSEMVRLLDKATNRPAKPHLERRARPSIKIMETGRKLEKQIQRGITALRTTEQEGTFPHFALSKKSDEKFREILEKYEEDWVS